MNANSSNAREAAKLLPSFGAWVAFKYGKILRTKNQCTKLFRTKAEALKAARQSKMGFGPRR